MEMVVDENAIIGLASRQDLRPKFPFLGLTVMRRSCCNKPKTEQPNFEGIKANIAFMSQEKKAEFKEALGLSKVTVYYRTCGRVEKVEF